MKNINVNTAKTSELLAFYNAHAEKTVNKFTNLETARRRVTALIEASAVQSKPTAEPSKVIAKAPAQPVKAAPKASATVEQGRRSNAAGVAASWIVPEVRAARLIRQGVVVAFGKSVQEFTSTHTAFEALGLPMSKVIRFRMKLKAAGKLTFTFAGKTFEFTIL